jgi:hypothetical protein
MKIIQAFVIVLAITSLACGASTLTPTELTPPTLQPSEEAKSATTNISPSPTPIQLRLEIVQSQAWTDRDGNVRANVLMRNPYDFPVTPTFREGASILNSTGELIRTHNLYFLDGISGGGGFFLPGETIAATTCFTCETTPLLEAWQSVNFLLTVKEATDAWNYSTEVEASNVNVAFDGDSPIFDVTGTVQNKSDSALQRVSVRIFVFDENDNLVGAAEVSSWDVGAGVSVSFNGYGIGQKPSGAVKIEVSAVGVNY